MSETPNLGFSGKIASYFAHSQLTPLLAIIGFLLGLFALLITPREEEPQIDVTMANVFIPFPGAQVLDVENLATSPMEQILGEIQGVDHIYSMSRPGMAIITVQYKVGVPRTEALVRLYNAIYSNQDWRPANLGILQPLVKPKGIDDVPIVALTLWTKDPTRGAFDLKQIAHALETELKRIPGTRNITTIGGPEQVARIALSPQKLAARNLSINELRQALLSSNLSNETSGLVDHNQFIPVQAGEFLSQPEALSELIVGQHEGKPIYLQDVAEIQYGPAENLNYVSYGDKNYPPQMRAQAVTLTISKKSGENAVVIAEQIQKRLAQLQGSFIPEGVEVSITRNYGATAEEKASKLMEKLVFATASVVLLVLLTLGWREAMVVGIAVILTLAITLFASWAWGFTLNRVSLFALIFSIGILVDDAIVVVENIHRHLTQKAKSIYEIIPIAVNEVGGPTILATFTVIAALAPMAFVSGLMGPYMSPIPINASMGMLLSLTVALTVTPWLCGKLIKAHPLSPIEQSSQTALNHIFDKIMRSFLGEEHASNRRKLAGGIFILILLAISLIFLKAVIFKMLPFDNKSEFQVVVDMPEGTALEQTNATLNTLADYLITIPEVKDLQIYSGTASPIGFNGLVRLYYLRQEPQQGDIQVNLIDKHARKRTSHEIASNVRSKLQQLAKASNANIKVVEVPPGPPVLFPIVAEIYGPDYATQIAKAKQLRQIFENSAGIVDIDDSVEANAHQIVFSVERQKAAILGVTQAEITNAITSALGTDVTFLHTGHAKYPIPIRLELPIKNKADVYSFLALKLRSASGKLIPISEIVQVENSNWEKTIHHKDLLPVVYVTGDMADKTDSPLYGMLEIMGQLKNKIHQHFTRQPESTSQLSIKWDGEWQITYETFRDMGLAYSVGLILIYLLVVGQFRSYVVPLIIMAPIPLTLIGILPGHALLGAQFTATSMIGVIALAGIIVRNSILLVDFINKSLASGNSLEETIIQSAIVRSKPIMLTAVAAMMGAFFILDDPIFNGLAISLIFGILVSSLLTLLVIPLLYYVFLKQRNSGI